MEHGESLKPITIILPVVLYGRETWSVTLREEHRLRVLENRVLWKMSGPKREGVTGQRRLHKEIYGLYSSPIPFGSSTHEELVGRAEGKLPLGRPRRRWKDDNKMDLR